MGLKKELQDLANNAPIDMKKNKQEQFKKDIELAIKKAITFAKAMASVGNRKAEVYKQKTSG